MERRETIILGILDHYIADFESQKADLDHPFVNV
jgi:hypothetical protein